MGLAKQLFIAFAVFFSSVVLCALGGGLLGKFISLKFPHYYPSVFPTAATQPYFDAAEVGIGTGIGQGAVAGLLVGATVLLALAVANRRRDGRSVLPGTNPMISHSLETQIVGTKSRNQMIDVTDQVRKLVEQRGVSDGIVIVYVPHTTAAVTINENADPDVKHDMLLKLESLIPRHEGYYKHDEGNSDSHVKTSLVGNSVMVLIEKGQLVLGRWQGIYFCEFDGPRSRTMLVKLVRFE